VSQIEPRLKEAAKLGFDRAVVPENNLDRIAGEYDIDVSGADQLTGVVDVVL
jgi:DNA repair protein RadA/Sms